MTNYVKSLGRTPATRREITALDIYTVPPKQHAIAVAERVQMRKLQHLLEAIWAFYARVKSTEKIVLDTEDLAQLEIDLGTYQTLDTPVYGCRTFFRPLPAHVLQYYPIIENDLNNDSQMSIEHAIVWRFSQARRYRIPANEYGFGRTLGYASSWYGPCTGVSNRITTKSFGIGGRLIYKSTNFRGHLTWERRRRSQPHFTFTMSHDIEPHERLLKEEVVQIMAAIQCRIYYEVRKNKNWIIPIQALSFMRQHGRIIQAYYNGSRLVIRKTRLYSFTDYATAPFDLFVRHLASEPVGTR